MVLCRAVLRFYSKDELPGKLFKLVLVIWACFAWISLAVVLVLYLSGRPCFMELIQQENGSYILRSASKKCYYPAFSTLVN